MVDVLLRFLFESEGRTEVRVLKVSLIIIFISYRFGIIKEENTQNLDYALIMVTVKEVFKGWVSFPLYSFIGFQVI